MSDNAEEPGLQPTDADGSGVDQVIDARGLRCPEPLMLVRNQIRRQAPGATLQVFATDPSTERDLRDFCRFMGHELVSSEERDGVWQFVLRKGG